MKSDPPSGHGAVAARYPPHPGAGGSGCQAVLGNLVATHLGRQAGSMMMSQALPCSAPSVQMALTQKLIFVIVWKARESQRFDRHWSSCGILLGPLAVLSSPPAGRENVGGSTPRAGPRSPIQRFAWPGPRLFTLRSVGRAARYCLPRGLYFNLAPGAPSTLQRLPGRRQEASCDDVVSCSPGLATGALPAGEAPPAYSGFAACRHIANHQTFAAPHGASPSGRRLTSPPPPEGRAQGPAVLRPCVDHSPTTPAASAYRHRLRVLVLLDRVTGSNPPPSQIRTGTLDLHRVMEATFRHGSPFTLE